MPLLGHALCSHANVNARGTGNIPALVKLMSIYLAKGDEFMSSQLGPCLGITQKLTSSKKWEAFGFELLEAVMEYIPV